MRVIAGLPLRLVTPPCWGPTGEAEQLEGLPVCPPWPASLPLLCIWEHLAPCVSGLNSDCSKSSARS
uniref:Uncharacterized protein n=1 Tax=Rhinopithecus roxellana TaxID=61622 RepID=A0A2K6QCG3_RHIRO